MDAMGVFFRKPTMGTFCNMVMELGEGINFWNVLGDKMKIQATTLFEDYEPESKEEAIAVLEYLIKSDDYGESIKKYLKDGSLLEYAKKIRILK